MKPRPSVGASAEAGLTDADSKVTLCAAELKQPKSMAMDAQAKSIPAAATLMCRFYADRKVQSCCVLRGLLTERRRHHGMMVQ